ncbi:MAG: PAS domain-containing protein [Victivallaceae bacterium]|nr:PAS domain-containing protein [Victivallaceae bacterium]
MPQGRNTLTPHINLNFPPSAGNAKAVRLSPPEQPDFLQIRRSHFLLGGMLIALLIAALGGAVAVLWRSRSRHRKIYAAFSGRIVVVNEAEEILYLNAEPGCRDDLRGIKSLREIPHIDEKKLSAAVQEVFRTGKIITDDYEYRSEQRIFSASLLDENVFGQKAVIWFSQNNTALHDARRQAEEQARWLRLTLQSIGDGVITTDASGRIVMMNPVASRMTAVSREEAIGKPHDEIFNIVSAINEEPIESPVMRTLRTGMIVELANHTNLLGRDGKCYHIADSAAPIIDENGGIIGAILVFRDVTEAYARRDKLQKVATSLEYASELTNSAAFEFYPASRKLTGSKKIKELWPISSDGVAIDVHEWVYPDDRQKVEQQWSALFAREKSEISVDYRVLKDGAIHYYRLKGSLDSIGGSQELCVVGVIQDVTEITTSILNLKGDLELWTRVINTLPVMIFAKDVRQNFRYVQCNQAFFDFCDCEEEAVLGHTDEEILPESAEQIHQYDLSVSESGKLCHFETEWKDRKGISHPLKIVKKLFVDPRGRQLLIGAATDITELHHVIRNERAIKESLSCVILDPSFEDTFRQIAVSLHNLLRCERIVLGKYEDDGHLRFHREWHEDGMSDLNTRPLECIHQTWDDHLDKLRRDELFVFDEDAIELVNRTYNPSGIKDRILQAITAAPVFLNDRFWGTLFVSFIAQKHQFSESDKMLIAAMADILALAQVRDAQRRKIQQSSQEKQLLLDNINMPVWLHDGKGELLWANAKVSEIPNFPAGHLTTEENQKIFCENLPDDVVYPVSKVIETKQEAVTKISFGGRDYATWTRPVLDDRQKLLYIVKSAMDITDLNQSTQAQKVLTAGLKTFLSESDMKKAFTRVLEEIQRFFHCQRCYIMMFDSEAQTGTTIAECVADGVPKMWESVVNHPYKLDGDWIKSADAKRSLVLCPDTRTEYAQKFFGSWYPLIRLVKSYYGAALYFNGKFWGILGLSFDAYNRELSVPEVDFMKMLNGIFELYFSHEQAEKQILDALTQAQNAAKPKAFSLPA